MDHDNNYIVDNKPPELPNGKSFHIFISYATMDPDRQIAEDMYTKLTEMNYKCCLHEIEFKAGHMIQENIDKFMKISQKTIVLLSENFKNSYWCSIEMIEIVSLHMEDKGFPPIILKLDSCEVPEAFKPYTYMSVHGGLDEKMADIIDSVNDLEITKFSGRLLNISFVPLPCINYNQDVPHSPCIWPHICAKFILSNYACDGSCNKHHVINAESLEKLKKCGFPTDRSLDYLITVYKDKCKEWLKEFPAKTISGPCFYYNDKGCFSEDDMCPFPHICKEWFIDNCSNSNCQFSHDISNKQTTRLFQAFGINTNQPDDIIMCQYREKCPNYLELKSKCVSKSNVLKHRLPLINIGKSIFCFVIGVMSYNIIVNIFEALL